MQAIAAEMNLSETAFFVPDVDKTGEYDLRWFTPTVEVDLCGHATLASGKIVFDHLDTELETITFHTRSGALGVAQRDDLIELDLPANTPTTVEDPSEISKVASALGAIPAVVLHGNFTVAVFDAQRDVAALRPDFTAMSKLPIPWLVATAPADNDSNDFVSRCFVPTAGVNEDPVTGSSHATLVPYWAERLGKSDLIARQISKRGGTLYCDLAGDRVKIAGRAIEIMSGELNF